MKKSLLLRLTGTALGLATLLCGCGATPQSTAAVTTEEAPAYAGEAYDYNAAYDEGYYETGESAAYAHPQEEPAAEMDGGSAGVDTDDVPKDERMVIMTAWVTLQALEYEDTLDALLALVEQSGAYVAASSQYNSAVGYRSADYTIKVPAGSYTAFMKALEEVGNVTSRSESSEDVTTQYIDVEARLSSLKAQEERLLELMAQAGDLESLILVQQQLTEVQYQIEYYQSTQRTLQRQVAYSTITVDVHEVQVYTEPEPETFISRLGRAFTGGWREAGLAVQEIALWLTWLLPLLLFFAAVAVVVVVMLRRRKKRKSALKTPRQAIVKPALKDENSTE